MTYILIGTIIVITVSAIICGLLYSSIKREEAEIEQLFRKHDYLVKELCDSKSKVDAEVAYLEYLYGVDEYTRGNREDNKS